MNTKNETKPTTQVGERLRFRVDGSLEGVVTRVFDNGSVAVDPDNVELELEPFPGGESYWCGLCDE